MLALQHKILIKGLMKKYDSSNSGNLNVCSAPFYFDHQRKTHHLLFFSQRVELKALLKDLNDDTEPTEAEVTHVNPAL